MMTFPAWKDGWGKVFSSDIVVDDGSDLVRSYLSPNKTLQQRGSYEDRPAVNIKGKEAI